MRCTKHPHSSEERARKCFVKEVRKRADRKLALVVNNFNSFQRRKERMTKRYGTEYTPNWLMCDECKCMMPQDQLDITKTDIFTKGKAVITRFTRRCIDEERCNKFAEERDIEVKLYESMKMAEAKKMAEEKRNE